MRDRRGNIRKSKKEERERVIDMKRETEIRVKRNSEKDLSTTKSLSINSITKAYTNNCTAVLH